MTGPATESASQSAVPLFSVVSGSPTEEELAALVVVLAGRQVRSGPPPPAPPSGWSAYWRTVRAPVQPGPGAWRLAGRV